MTTISVKAINENLTFSTNPDVTPNLTKQEAATHTNGWIPKTISWNFDSLRSMAKNDPYCQSEFSDGQKLKASVTAMHFFAIDFDKGETTFNDYKKEKLPTFDFSVFMHTTVNHQKEIRNIINGEEVNISACDKFRVIVPLSRTITNAEAEQIKASGNIQKLFSLHPADIDMSFIDSNRFFKQNPDALCYFHDSSLRLNPDYLLQDVVSSDKPNNCSTPKHVDIKFSLDLVIKTSDGRSIKVSDVKNKEKIYCPFCDPKGRTHPNASNAFIDCNEKGAYYIFCSSESKTYWQENLSSATIGNIVEKYWSYGTSVYEAGLVSDVFSLENIGEKKFYTKVKADSKEEKKLAFDFLVNNKHLHRLNRIDNIGDINVVESKYEISMKEGNILVRVKALPVKLHDNDFIENYLEEVFGVYKNFIKEWLSIYVYTNYQKLPSLILTGVRGTGKNTFAESVLAIFPTLSEISKELDGNFNPFAEKKLLIIDESASGGKVQYQMLKKFSGQKYLEVNKKYLPQYQVKNNLNIIFLSNDEQPIYVERDEMPSSVENNQFFVYRLALHAKFDPTLQEKIIDRLGYYIRTELKSVFENLKQDGFRYSIEVPITDEERKLFQMSVTDIQFEADKVIEQFESSINNPLSPDFKFINKGLIPSDFFENSIKNPSVMILKLAY